ncbi:uncharacterized protein LOC132718225 [Ruditapes philippinarum]|uniref:uncharacterized protein LOC132718225 n=1 Tax=Ruditapes philippinarum TaxID=129788 RepID=UPI00295B2C8B|nr:uncharacterized protein LOC132718225 [Ruditapes philippinarum]
MKIVSCSGKSFESLKHELMHPKQMEYEPRGDQIDVSNNAGKCTPECKEHMVEVALEQSLGLCNEIKVIRRGCYFVTCLNMVLLCICFIVSFKQISEDERKFANYTSIAETSNNKDDNTLHKYLTLNESLKIVQEQIFCTTCEAISGIERLFVRTVDGDRCCVKDVPDLIQLIRSTSLKSLSEYSSEISILRANIDDIREDTKALTNELFSSNKTNDTERNIGLTARENIMWSMLMKNNRLFNLVLNRRRSVLYLIGTAVDNGMYWSVETATGDLSYEGNNIHVNSGGQYMINCNIHFSKNVCDGTENMGYTMNKEYQSGEILPIARARASCASGSKIDENLQLQTVLQVGLGQRLLLELQWDNKSMSMISKWTRNHHIIIYEI